MAAMHSYLKYSNTILLIGSIIVLTILSISHIYMPFYGDQAFFLTGAKIIQEGGILYRDFWDFKQPGIFYFFKIGGNVFSFTEEGIHLFEIFYWTIFSITLMSLTIKDKIFTKKLFNYLIPFLTVGIYLNISSKSYITQVEILVSAPLTILVFLLYSFRKSKRFDVYFIIGVLIAFILLLKLAFIIAVGSLLAFQFILLYKDKVSFKTICVYYILPLSLGFILALIPFIFYSIRNDILELVYDTFFVAPFDVIDAVRKKSPVIFFMNFAKYLIKTFPLIIFSGLAIIQNIKKRNELVDMLTVLLFTSIYIIYMQKFSYFTYHYLVLLIPQGILTLIFFDNFFTTELRNEKWLQIRRSKFYMLVLFLSLFGIQEYYFIKKTKAVLSYFPLKGSNSLDYKEFFDPEYRSYYEETRFLREDEGEFEIFVCGDPLIYYLSNRKQAIPSNGWALELYTDERWMSLKIDIAKKKPKYIYVSNSYEELVRSKNVLSSGSEYELYKSGVNGNWYKKLDKDVLK